MKAIFNLVRIIVGVLFIFSGLVKANDPLGLSYKMQEFFEIWSTGLAGGSFFLKDTLISLFDFLHEHTLFLSVVIIAFEIIAGAALLIGWRMKLFIWLLLLLIIFFTFLTAYAFLSKNPDGSPKFTNCGCFGDCLPITPFTSFMKDVILTVLIVFLFAKRKWINPVLSAKAATITMLLVTLFSFGIQWYALNYLPFVDCLPYKKGKNISEQMKMPANAIPDSTEITFLYEKEGKQVEFNARQFPDDFNDSVYHFIKRYDKVIRKGKNNQPPIKGFALTGDRFFDTLSGQEKTNDSTDIILSMPYAILIIGEDFTTTFPDWQKQLRELTSLAREKNIPVFGITSFRDNAIQLFSPEFSDIQLFNCDNTAIRTAARTNPSFYILKQGTIVDKQGYKKMDVIISQVKSI